MGNATMGLNVPVLLISNMLMFRNALSGGFNTSRRELSKRVVVGAAGKSEAEAALKTAKENLKNLGKDATKAERQAAKKAVKEAEKKLANS
jgi:F0F1-type ATP synthase membrane subunit b/b'